MAVYPPYLSAEEKALKKRYAKLQEKVDKDQSKVPVHTHINYGYALPVDEL